jgi:hypothetical protein
VHHHRRRSRLQAQIVRRHRHRSERQSGWRLVVFQQAMRARPTTSREWRPLVQRRERSGPAEVSGSSTFVGRPAPRPGCPPGSMIRSYGFLAGSWPVGWVTVPPQAGLSHRRRPRAAPEPAHSGPTQALRRAARGGGRADWPGRCTPARSVDRDDDRQRMQQGFGTWAEANSWWRQV